ncbi:hypothetical protein [Rhabdaerophilum sp.]|uniref:hypothetical protein n=1 Tax=Rhabdaerophilum sp. TaxID=2717341 RepID=UPI0038D41D25
MLYIVGGCSRSGKSTLAEHIRKERGIPWFSLDALRMGLVKGAPGLEIKDDTSDLVAAEKLWPIVKGVLEQILYDRRDYLVEGVNLQPKKLADFKKENRQITACFLGYPDMDLQKKLENVRDYPESANNWLKDQDDDFVRQHLERSRDLSRLWRNECREVGLPFFDTGPNFETGLRDAEACLFQGA